MTDQPRINRARTLLDQMLDKGYTRATAQTIRAIVRNSTTGVMEARLAAFEAEAARLAAAGKPMTRDNPYYRVLIADFEAVLRRDAALIDASAERVQRVGLDAAKTLTRQLALPGVSDQQLQVLGVQWNTPDPDAIARIAEYTTRPAWQVQLEQYAQGAAQAVQDTALRNIVEGRNPLTVAREVRRMVEGLPARQANNLMRTLQLTAYRDATAMHQLANADILSHQVRIASLDRRCCFVAGTLITTRYGQKPIELIKSGEEVLTHGGRYRRVVATMNRDYVGKAITLSTVSRSFTATANHPVLIGRGGKRNWIPAESVQIGDCAFVEAKNGADNTDHFRGYIAIKRSVGNSYHSKPTSDKTGSFAQVGIRPGMPVNPVDFKSQVQSRNKEVYRIAVYAGLLLIWLIQSFKAQSNVGFWLGFALIATIATWRTELLVGHRRHNTKFFAASQTHLDCRWAAAFFGTVMSLVSFSVALLPRYAKDLAASFTRHIQRILGFARLTAKRIPICIGRGNRELFVASGAGFSDTILCHLNIASTTTVSARPSIPVAESLATVGACSESVFTHDVIISRVASVVKTRVYNLEVDQDHSYIANGIVVHNCMACIALHGTKLPLGQRILDHHQGRCTAIAVTTFRPRNIQPGEAWFAGQPEAIQRQYMGHAAYSAWKDGKIALRDFPQEYDDPTFGRMIRESSLRGMLGDSAKQFYGRGAA